MNYTTAQQTAAGNLKREYTWLVISAPNHEVRPSLTSTNLIKELKSGPTRTSSMSGALSISAQFQPKNNERCRNFEAAETILYRLRLLMLIS
jgi:hypothetical protein